LSEKPTKIKRKEVIEIFNDLDNFKNTHLQKGNYFEIENWIQT